MLIYHAGRFAQDPSSISISLRFDLKCLFRIHERDVPSIYEKITNQFSTLSDKLAL